MWPGTELPWPTWMSYFVLGWQGALNITYTPSSLPAVSGLLHSLPAAFSLQCCQEECLKSLLITVKSERHGISPQHTLSISVGTIQEGSQTPFSYSAHDCSEVPNFLLGSWVQETRGMWEPTNVFQEKPWHTNSSIKKYEMFMVKRKN